MGNNLEDKIKSRSEIVKLVHELKKENKKIGFTNGCFDIIHRGHVEYLARAKSNVDVLIVGLNSDSSAHKLKGSGRPLNNQYDRAIVLAGLASVDYIVIFEEETPYLLIKEILPHYLFKGGDWKKEEIVGADIVEENGGCVEIIPYLNGYSTSDIIAKAWRIKS